MLKYYLYVTNWVENVVQRSKNDEDGVETIEWIGLAALVLVIIGAIATFVENDKGQTVGSAILNRLALLISGE